MMLDLNLLLFCLVGGVVSADTDAAWQTLISQPLVACPVAGLLLGNTEMGLMVGVLLQLPYLVEIPAGTAKISLGNLGAFVAAGLAAKLAREFPGQANTALFLSIVFGILLSWLTTPLLRSMRQLNLHLVRKADTAAEDGRLRTISIVHYLGVLNSYVFGLFFSAIFLFLGMIILASVGRLFPQQFETSLQVLKPVLLGAGIGAMVWLFVKKTTMRYAILGAGLSLLVLILKG